VNGIAAGLSTKSTRSATSRQTDPAGAAQRQFVHAGRPQVNPNATVQLIVTGDWALPVREAEAAKRWSMPVRHHCLSHRTAQGGIETAEKRGVKTCGHNADQASLAPKASSPAPTQVGHHLQELSPA